MRTTPHLALTVALALTLGAVAPRALLAQDSTQTAEQKARQLLAPVFAASRVRDSLSVLADKAVGEQSVMLEEQIWLRQAEIQSGLLNAAAELEKWKRQGGDLAGARPLLEQTLRTGWPRYLRQLERRGLVMLTLFEKRDTATPAQRLAIETEITEYSERTARMFRDLIDALLAVEHLGVDVGLERRYLVEKLSEVAEQTKARVIVLGRAEGLAAARVQRTPDDATARVELEATAASFDRATRNLQTEIDLLERLGVDATPLKVSLIVSTGKLTAAVFERGVVAGLLRHGQERFLDMLATRGPHWMFQALIIALILVGFGLLAKLVRKLVRRGIAHADVSQLLKDTTTSWSSKLIMAIGIAVVLRQLGFQLGPMLAGLGIAGFVIGFALQDTFSNFAAGGMILAYHPYDIGDIIEAGGAMGTVKKMSLVSTTILTFDNQTLIVPNKKMWGDVIRNITAQDRRRVDLTFAVGYGEDVAKVEGLLREIVNADLRVLKEPAPIIKLHQLSESSVNFVVRAWTLQEHYWDVYWDTTRAVKLRFDQEGIKIPFPQRELHVNMIPGQPADPK